MDSCKYHPLDGATFACRTCNHLLCDHCIDDENEKSRCFICGSALDDLGSVNKVEPFWRRLPEAFKYPLNSSSISLILITAVLSVVASLMAMLFIVAIPLYLFATGALIKYGFTCLERTSYGEMKAPDVMEAYHGGIKLILLLFLITVLLTFLVGGAYYLSPALGSIFGLLVMIAFPAILIRFAQTENIIDALNPVAITSLITAIGLPYGLLMAFLMIMMSSIGVLHEMVSSVLPAASYFVQAIISNYYTIVMFHLMGYMLFQYQGQLGYSARSDEDETPVRNDTDRFAAKISIFLKEGNYEKVVDLYYQAFKLFPNDAVFFDKFFELTYSCKKAALMEDFGLLYLEFLNRKKRFDKLTISFKQILHLAPDYLPNSAAIRVQLANLLRQQGDLKLAVKLLNGMHKIFPDYAELPDAYNLLADILTDMPNMQMQADKCRQMVAQLIRRAEEKQKAIALAAEEKQKAAQANAITPPQTKRKGPPPPGIKSSGLVLELVPLEPIIENLTPP